MHNILTSLVKNVLILIGPNVNFAARDARGIGDPKSIDAKSQAL